MVWFRDQFRMVFQISDRAIIIKIPSPAKFHVVEEVLYLLALVNIPIGALFLRSTIGSLHSEHDRDEAYA